MFKEFFQYEFIDSGKLRNVELKQKFQVTLHSQLSRKNKIRIYLKTKCPIFYELSGVSTKMAIFFRWTSFAEKVLFCEAFFVLKQEPA
jgi:hypothetical protein